MGMFRKAGLILAAFALLATAAFAQSERVDLRTLGQRAETGDAEAQFQLAERLRTGQGILQNYTQAANWYSAAADQGHSASLNSLGALYISGLGVEQDAATGLSLLADAAKSGEAQYIHDLAIALQNGIGADPDPAGAAELFQQASDKGWVESTVSLGVLYQDGIGVGRDVARAAELYAGPAEAGHARAQNNLGLLYVRGDGVLQDYKAAVSWFSKAAQQGLPTAMTNLGVMYQNGFGVEQDEDRANELYRLAAEAQGNTAAAALSGFVFDPRLQPPDPDLLEVYLAAAEAGDPVAEFLMGYLLVTSSDGTNFRLAARYFENAANKGLPTAMANLGILYFGGKGVLQDYVEGYKWLTLAAVNGPHGLIGLRDSLATRMTAEQINAANALAQTALANMVVQ